MITSRIFSIVMCGVLSCSAFWFNPSFAGEPRPEVNQAFSQEEEAKVQGLKSLRTQAVFEELKKPYFRSRKSLSYKALYTALEPRKAEALDTAEKYLKEPLMEVMDGQRINRVRDFNVAKMVFETFPDDAVPRLLTLYRNSDGITRGNIVRAASGISAPAVDSMLIESLDDKTAAEEEAVEQVGEPLRVCDTAYNQIVLKYGVRKVLRTISPAHKIAIRDYHIGVLKSEVLDYSLKQL